MRMDRISEENEPKGNTENLNTKTDAIGVYLDSLHKEMFEFDTVKKETKTKEIKEFFETDPVRLFEEIVHFIKDLKETYPLGNEFFIHKISLIIRNHCQTELEALSPIDHLKLCILINDVEEMRSNLGGYLNFKFLDRLAKPMDTTENRVKDLCTNIALLPDGEREVVINQLETIYAVSDTAYSFELADQRLRDVIEYFIGSKHPLSRIVAEVAFKRIDSHDSEKNDDPKFELKAREFGKIDSISNIPSVENKIYSDLPFGYKAVVSASDVFIGLDHSGMPCYVALVDGAKAQVSESSIEQRNVLEKGRYERSATAWRTPGKKFSEKESFDKKEPSKINFRSFDDLAKNEEFTFFNCLDKDDLLLLGQCLRPEVHAQLEEELGTSFVDISFRAQVALLRFLSKETQDTYTRLIDVLELNPEEKVRIIETFVGCSEDVSFGQEFLAVCEHSQGNELKTLLDMYGGIVLHAKEVGDVITADSRAGNITPEMTASFMKLSIKKAHTMLQEWSHMAETSHQQGSEYIPDVQALEHYKSEEVQSAVYASIFQSLRKEYGKEALDVIGGFDSKEAYTLSEKELQEVELMYRENYEKRDPKLCKALIKIFKERTEKKDVTAYMLKDKEKIVSFLTIEPFKESRGYHRALDTAPLDNELYFGSFNTDASYQGVSIGDAMMRKVIDKYAKDHIVHGDCPLYVPIGAKYVEDGFVGVSLYDYKNTPSMEIVRDETQNASLQTKKMNKDIFVKNTLEFELNNGSGLCDMGSYCISKAENQDQIDMSPIERGFILTRYFMNTSTTKKEWYAVFEKADK